MHIVKVSKSAGSINVGQLYDEIIAAVPALAPTPTGPGGRLVAQVLIEQTDPDTLLVHLPDDVGGADEINTIVKGHKRKPEKTVDPVSDARKLVKKKADQGDELAQAVLTLLGQ